MNSEAADTKDTALESPGDQLSKAKAIVFLTMLAAQGADSNSDGKMEAIYVQNAMDAGAPPTMRSTFWTSARRSRDRRAKGPET
jgi:hypothetical protein